MLVPVFQLQGIANIGVRVGILHFLEPSFWQQAAPIRIGCVHIDQWGIQHIEQDGQIGLGRKVLFPTLGPTVGG